MLVHGGMAQDVRPDPGDGDGEIPAALDAEWAGRQEAMRLFDKITGLLTSSAGDIAPSARHRAQLPRPIQTIIPWASNPLHETLIERARAAFSADFWGFWMLGGMASGGMGFIFDPARKAEAQGWLQEMMRATNELEVPCPLPWTRRLRLCHQRARHLGRVARRAARRSCPPATLR